MDVTDTLKDAAYVVVGAALIGINKAQGARPESMIAAKAANDSRGRPTRGTSS